MHSTITAGNSRRSNLTRWLVGLVAALSMSVAFAAPAQASGTAAQDDEVCVPTGGYPVCVGVGSDCGPTLSVCVEGWEDRLRATIQQLEDGYWELHWMVYPYREKIACALNPGSCD